MIKPVYTHRGGLSGVRPSEGFIGPVWPYSMSAGQLADNRAIMLAGVERERAWREEPESERRERLARAAIARRKAGRQGRAPEWLGIAASLVALVLTVGVMLASPPIGCASLGLALVLMLAWRR